MKVSPRWSPYLVALLGCAALTAFAAYDLARERSRAFVTARVNTANVAKLLEAHTRQSLRRIERLLLDAESQVLDDLLSSEAPGQRTELERQLAALLPGDGLVNAMVWLGVDQRPLAATGAGLPGGGAADWLNDLQARQRLQPPATLSIGRLWKDAAGTWRVPIGRPVAGPQGRAAGLLVAWVDLKTLQPVLDAVDTGGSGFVSLFRRDGWILATAPRNESLFDRFWGEAPMFTELLPRGPTGTVQQVVVRDGTERVYSYRELADFPIVVSAGISMTDALADWRARLLWNSVLLVLVGAASAWSAWAVSRNRAQRDVAEQASAAAARHTQAIVDHAAEGILTLDAAGCIVSCNPAGAAMFGGTATGLIGQSIDGLLPGFADRARTADADDALDHAERPGPGAGRAATVAAKGAADGSIATTARRRDGNTFAAEFTVAAASLAQGDQSLRIVQVRDVTERLRAQAEASAVREQIERNERFLRRLTDSLPLGLAYVDGDLRFRFVNRARCERMGLPREAILGHTREELTGRAPPPDLMGPIEQVLLGHAQRFVSPEAGPAGTQMVESFLEPDVDPEGQVVGFYAASSDVTERLAQQRQLEGALAERETLLREVYHRVKNNLQVVQSLLNLQRRTLPVGPARAALDESVLRVQSMALVHEKLYQTGNLDAVSLRDYTADLLKHLGDAAGAGSRGIVLQADVALREVSLELAVPFGLLVTELVGNSLKHGFPHGRRGTVQVQLHQGSEGTWLRVRDDGIGLPAAFDLSGSTSMGLQLAASLAVQLGGRLAADPSDGGGCQFVVHLARMDTAAASTSA
jgi:PAS domain S-box-containing protein